MSEQTVAQAMAILEDRQVIRDDDGQFCIELALPERDLILTALRGLKASLEEALEFVWTQETFGRPTRRSTR